MKTITVVSGFGYLKNAAGRIVTKAKIPPGEHQIANNMTYVEVADQSELDAVAVEEDATVVETRDREAKREEVKTYGLARITGFVPAWDTLAEVAFLASIWNMLNTGAATPDQILAKDTAVYTKGKMSLAMTGPIAQVRVYDPATDTGWPS